MYVAGVSTKTAKRYFKNVEEQVIQLQSKVWSNNIYSASKTKEYLLKNSTIGNCLLFLEKVNTGITCPENLKWYLVPPQSNLFFEILIRVRGLIWEGVWGELKREFPIAYFILWYFKFSTVCLYWRTSLSVCSARKERKSWSAGPLPPEWIGGNAYSSIKR